MLVSAYVPCFNNAATVRETIASLQAQSFPPAEIIVVDDGSTDETPGVVGALPVTYLRLEQNTGRGNVRQTAMEAAAHPLVLCCDATNRLATNFLESALPWFDNPSTAAVYGILTDEDPKTARDRWRQRHLFRPEDAAQPTETDSLITWGTLIRKASVANVGGFNRTMRHSEDADLGTRLVKAGDRIFRDPSLKLHPLVSNPPGKLCERFLRWYLGPTARLTLRDRLRFSIYALKVLARRDLKAGDPAAALISVRCGFASWAYQK